MGFHDGRPDSVTAVHDRSPLCAGSHQAVSASGALTMEVGSHEAAAMAVAQFRLQIFELRMWRAEGTAKNEMLFERAAKSQARLYRACQVNREPSLITVLLSGKIELVSWN